MAPPSNGDRLAQPMIAGSTEDDAGAEPAASRLAEGVGLNAGGVQRTDAGRGGEPVPHERLFIRPTKDADAVAR